MLLAPNIEQDEEAPVDFSRRFMPEEFTPLFHTSEYVLLPEAARRRYNQLHALYFNEQVAFFEQEMLSPALRALLGGKLPADLAAGLRTFFAEEQIHTAMFRALNRRCAPDLYRTTNHHFVTVTGPWRWLLARMVNHPHLFPLIVWLALLQEERSLFYSKGFLVAAHELEPNFVAAHRTHLADEVGHIGWDEKLLDWLWPQTSRVIRQANIRLLGWSIGEFFLLPKRSGRRVIDQLGREFPQLDSTPLHHALAGLAHNQAYLPTLYSHEVTPRAFARWAADPEFTLLARTFSTYAAPGIAP